MEAILGLRPLQEREKLPVATLVDTSVWIGHFRKTNLRLVELLESRDILIHSAVLGEIAAGTLKNRERIFGDLKRIQRAIEPPFEEVLDFIELQSLYGRGLSWVDIQILASCLVSGCQLFTEDKQLLKTFDELKGQLR